MTTEYTVVPVLQHPNELVLVTGFVRPLEYRYNMNISVDRTYGATDEQLDVWHKQLQRQYSSVLSQIPAHFNHTPTGV